jgi:hypothetical protein
MAVAATADAATTRVRIIWHPPLLILKMWQPWPRPGVRLHTKCGSETAKRNQLFPYIMFAGDRQKRVSSRVICGSLQLRDGQ